MLPNLSSLIARMLMLLLLVFAVSLGVVYFIIDQRGKPEVTQLASQTVIETGNDAVNGIIAQLNQIDGMAMATSRMVGSLPKNGPIINQSVGHLLANTDSKIIGGGVWYDPDMYQQGVEQRAFVWRRDKAGEMKPDPQYVRLNPALPRTEAVLVVPTTDKATGNKLATPYHRDWWYVPAMYANHDHCVWSRAYIQASSGQPMITCAKALFNGQTNGFEGVVSLDVLLSQLQKLVQQWQEKTGGYVFLVDMNNNFLTFPKEEMVKQVTANNPQGEMMHVSVFASKYPDFAPISKSLATINNRLTDEAKKIDEGKFDFVSHTIVSGTNLQRTTQEEAEILTALLMTNGKQDSQVNAKTHFFEQVNVGHDIMLNKPSTAFIFAMPMTNWKLVIVKPDNDLTAFANQLNKQLQWYLLLGFLPVLLLSAYVFRRLVGSPLGRVAREVQALGDLIEQKRYLALNEHKLPPTKVTEIAVIADSMNQLIDRVVENEGALAKVNERLEEQVVERTEHLNQALKDLKKSQVQLVQAEKMSTLGQMVAGVAHEVNTPLGYVRSNLDLIDGNLERYDELVKRTQQLKTLMEAPDTSDEQVEQAVSDTIEYSDELVQDELYNDLSALLDDAQFGVSQISELVLNLRDFARLDEAKVKEININDCINSSLVIARNNIKHLEVVKDLQATSLISCNPSQINQVLLNLFNNAAQAMNETDGILTVNSFEDVDNVYITVADNGSGMPDDVKAQIFEPFFTTKPAGVGTGLGLAISAQILEQHQGSIGVESQIGKGTMFTLRLPKTRTQPPTKKSTPLLIA